MKIRHEAGIMEEGGKEVAFVLVRNQLMPGYKSNLDENDLDISFGNKVLRFNAQHILDFLYGCGMRES